MVSWAGNMIPQAVRDWCQANAFGEVAQVQPVAGGCINNGALLKTGTAASFFLKTNTRTPPDMFEREAEGLRALQVGGGPHIPAVFLVGPDFILLEDLAPARRVGDFWERFGGQLAALHSHTFSSFGFDHDNYIGSTPQPNPWTANGYQFFAEQRLGFQAKLAFERSLLDRQELKQVEKLAQRLPDLLPEQPASLIHGDLWGGNALADAAGQPALIDPATHYGWAEAELGMTRLFGGFPDEFYRAYEQARPLPPGLGDRLPVYNLYHLLNHLNLFGAGYHGQVQSILRRYAS
jgi:protein-ribulosamine 3-kinase